MSPRTSFSNNTHGLLSFCCSLTLMGAFKSCPVESRSAGQGTNCSSLVVNISSPRHRFHGRPTYCTFTMVGRAVVVASSQAFATAVSVSMYRAFVRLFKTCAPQPPHFGLLRRGRGVFFAPDVVHCPCESPSPFCIVY